jgi:hypothetical protein
VETVIRAQATVKQQTLSGHPCHIFHVFVSSPDRPEKREYVMICDSEDEAAQQGLRRYENEFDPHP